MNWSEFIKDYLHFTRKDRIGILVILCLVGIIFFAPTITSKVLISSPKKQDRSWFSSVKRLETKQDENDEDTMENINTLTYQLDKSMNHSSYEKEVKAELFAFDPNRLDYEGWKKLGLKDKTIHTIQNYLAKGGHFYKKEDLKKIYGLHPEKYEKLAPYIKIQSEFSKSNTGTANEYARSPVEINKSVRPRYSVIDINEADTISFISLPGIGSKLASRIVNFREKLGGFYSIEQIRETYGLPDSAFLKIRQYLKLGNTSIKKININTATIDELKAHPYIKFSLANPIVAYRNEHGAFSKIEDIKKIMAITDEVYKKMVPYLTIE